MSFFEVDIHAKVGLRSPPEERMKSPVQRVKDDLTRRGVTATFHCVPSDFEAQTWEWRRACLGMASMSHCCKSMLLENTAHSEATSSPSNRRFYVAVLPYTERFDSAKVSRYFRDVNPGLGRRNFNFHVADSGEALSGFTKGAFTPFGMLTPVPVLLSDKVLALSPPRCVLGGGHIDIKLEITTEDLVRALAPMVVDFTVPLTESEMEACQPGPRPRGSVAVQTIILDPAHSFDADVWQGEWQGLLADLASHPVLGLDMEWTTVSHETEAKRTFSKTPVALLQLSTAKRCLLLRWCNIAPRLSTCPVAKALHAAAVSVLIDPSVFKVGVGIMGDRTKFFTDFNIDVVSCVELAVLRKIVETGYEGRSCKSLKILAEEVCGVTMTKDLAVTLSDWADGTTPLSPLQAQYAADDAVCSFMVAETLLFKFHSEADDHVGILRSAVGMHPPKDNTNNGGYLSSQGSASLNTSIVCAPAPTLLPLGKTKKAYRSIAVTAYDGSFLLTIDEGKEAEWYVTRKRRAEVTKTCEEGKYKIAEIRLLHVPTLAAYHKGIHMKHRDCEYRFYSTSHLYNVCVVCGSGSNLKRHMIVPAAFRKPFPSEYMHHKQFDKLIVCATCSLRIVPVYEAEEKKVSQTYVVGYDAVRIAELGKMASAILDARKGAKTIPALRLAKLAANFSDTSDATLLAAQEKGKVPLGELVINELLALGAGRNREAGVVAVRGRPSHIDSVLGEFVVGWRRRFVEALQPKFLPNGWDVREGWASREPFLFPYNKTCLKEQEF